MEKRDEIKEGVKARVIEMLAEQLLKDNSFELLKKELLEELLTAKEETAKKQEEKNITKKIEDIDPKKRSIWLKELGFPYNEDAVRNRLEEMGFNHPKENFITERRKAIEVLNDIKAGKLAENLKTFTTEDSSYEPDYGEVVEKMKTNPFFMSSNPIPTTLEKNKFKDSTYYSEKIEFMKKAKIKFPTNPYEDLNTISETKEPIMITGATFMMPSESFKSGVTTNSIFQTGDKPKRIRKPKDVSNKPKTPRRKK